MSRRRSSQSLSGRGGRLISLLEVRATQDEVYPEKEMEKLSPTEVKQTSFGNNSTIVAASLLLKSLFSPTILVMPAIFRSGGLFFTVFSHIFLVILISYNISRIVVCADYLSNREKLIVQTYDQVVFVSFDKCSPKTKNFAKQFQTLVNIMVIITNIDALTIFIIFLARNLRAIIDHYYPCLGFHVRHFIFFQMVPVMLINTIRQLKYLSPFSIMASIILFIACICIFQLYFIQNIPTLQERQLIGDYSILRSISMILFSQSGISISLTIKSSMKYPDKFLKIPGVYCITIILATIIYVPFGFFGYLSFGEDVYPSVMLNLPNHELKAIIIKFLTILSVLMTIPICFYVAFNVLWNNYIKYRIMEINRISCEYFFRALFIIILYGLASAFPTLGPMIVLKGALFHSQLEVIYPPIVEYVAFYPEKGNGKGYCRLIKAIIISSFGIFCCLSGTIIGIWDLVITYEELLN